MKKNMNKKTAEYFDFLANTLSISGVITWNDTEEPAKTTASDKKDNYFDILANSLSISKVVS